MHLYVIVTRKSKFNLDGECFHRWSFLSWSKQVECKNPRPDHKQESCSYQAWTRRTDPDGDGARKWRTLWGSAPLSLQCCAPRILSHPSSRGTLQLLIADKITREGGLDGEREGMERGRRWGRIKLTTRGRITVEIGRRWLPIIGPSGLLNPVNAYWAIFFDDR